MTTQTVEPTLPRYFESSLDALSTSILASLGVPGEPNPLRLGPADRVCLLIIDGLGWELLRAHPAAAPFLSEIAMTSSALTAGFPATTATSLGALGTGRPPGQHGLLGYQVAVPGTGKLLNALRWDQKVDPLEWQPQPTIFDRAAAAGVRAARVAPGLFRKSGLSLSAMRGATYFAANTLGALVSRAVAALEPDPPALAMVYYGDLDSTGHALGCTSDAWLYQLAHCDKLAEQLAGALPHGSVLHVTADHGMVDVPPSDRLDADAVPELRAGVALLGGEPRARHVYSTAGAAADVLATWTGVLGERAWVVSREQAVADGWFGPTDDALLGRIGDVVVAPCGTFAVVATVAEPRESALIGMHGSLTPAEQFVPLLTLPIGLLVHKDALAAHSRDLLLHTAREVVYNAERRGGSQPADQSCRAERAVGVGMAPHRARRPLAARRATWHRGLPERASARCLFRRSRCLAVRTAWRRGQAPDAGPECLRGGNARRRAAGRAAGRRLRRRGFHDLRQAVVDVALLRPRPRRRA